MTISLGVSTVEIEIENVLSVEINFFKVSRFSRWSRSFFFLVEVFKIETFQSRLWRIEMFVEIVETRQDCQDLSRRVKIVKKSQHCQGLWSLKMMKSLDKLRNLDEKIQKSMHFSMEIETNCQETPKFSDLDEFLDLDWDFLVWTLMWRQNREVSISIEISWSSRLIFLKCWYFLDMSR